MLVTLPNGLLDGVDHFNVAEIDELSGKQQDYLADKELVINNIGHVPKILEDMILSLQTEQGLKWKGEVKDAIWKLPSGDIETVLVKVRENTYGPRFYHQAQCTHEDCGHVNTNLRLDLDKLAIDVYPLEQLRKQKVLTLPKSGLEVELKPIFLKDLFEVIKITSEKTKTMITSVLAISMKRLGAVSPVTAANVAALKMSDIQFLQDNTEDLKLEGSIDTDIEIECDKCKKDFKMKLNVFDPSFFALTKGSPTSST